MANRDSSNFFGIDVGESTDVDFILHASGLDSSSSSETVYIKSDPTRDVDISSDGFSQSLSNFPTFWGLQDTPRYDTNKWPPFTSFGQPQLSSATLQNIASANVDPLLVSGSLPPPSFTPKPRHDRGTISVVSDVACAMTTPTLAVQEQLWDIAMPLHLQCSSPKSASSLDPATSAVKASAHSFDDGTRTSSKKRMMTVDVDDDKDEDEEEDDRLVKRTSHNMIEKRYRNRLNNNIAVLRDSVPSLRIVSKITQGEDTTDDREELHGLTPAHKLNKATVISKATEYINHLTKRDSRFHDQNAAMQARLEAFEKLLIAGAMSPPTRRAKLCGNQKVVDTNCSPSLLMSNLFGCDFPEPVELPYAHERSTDFETQDGTMGILNSEYFPRLPSKIKPRF